MTPLLLAAAAVAAGLFALVRKLLTTLPRGVPGATIRTPTDDTSLGPDGSVRSVQAADIEMPEATLTEMWTPANLERLARTYWAYLSRVTLGLIRVHYTERERFVVLLAMPFKLLTFQAPEYEMDGTRGVVRWRIERGLLVAPRGRGGAGYLEIEVRRLPSDVPGRARINVEVEVANFYPAIASALSRFVYRNTQSRIHVLVTYGFLRRLLRRELDESVTGRFAENHDELPAPRRERERV